MLKKKHSRTGTIIRSVVSILLIVLAGWVLLNRQFILDTFTVWQYSPSEKVKKVEKQAGFTDTGRFAFFATQPEIAEQAEFNVQCPRREQKSPILGCYTTTGRIFIYDVTNDKLSGIEEVTAVHEMLHAVWQRTGKAEQDKIAAKLEAEYAKINDADLHSRMDYYQRTEPGEFINELHSILGSEYSSLGSDLEEYYGKFFSRDVVLARHANYNSVYRQLTKESTDLLHELQTLSKSIETRSEAFRDASARLTNDVGTFNSRANAGGFSSIAQFNYERSVLMQRSTDLEAQRVAINADIDTYNGDYNRYKQIAGEIQTLNESIDSFHELSGTPAL